MNVVIAGASSMAMRVAEELMTAHHVVSLRGEGAPLRFDQLDIETVKGSGTSAESLQLAHVSRADAFVACADSDEENVVSCLAARKLGARRTICVLTKPGLLSVEGSHGSMADSLGIDQVVRPGEQLAEEIVRIVTVPGALDARVFAEGRVVLLRYAVEGGAEITAGPLKSLTLPHGVVVVMLRRGDDTIVPHGETRVEPGDKLVAMGTRHAMQEFSAMLRAQAGKEKRRAAIVGAGSVGVAIARGLVAAGWRVTLIEVDRERCEVVAGSLDCLVLHGDGADLDLLEQERIGEMPVVVCVTNNDEKNLLVSLLAKGLGVPRIITRADRLHNEHMFERLGVDVALSSRGAAIRNIVQCIDTSHSEIRAVLEHGSACVIELKLPPGFIGRKLAEVKPPEFAVVGSITRGRQVIIPRGSDELCPGDDLLVFCSTANEEDTHAFFTGVKGAESPGP